MKTLFLVPGFYGTPKGKCFQWLFSFLKEKKIKVIPVPITWKYRTIDHWVEEFKVIYKKNKSEENYVLGFSFGAAIALIATENLDFKKIFLCSLSPCFKEDYKPFGSKMKKYFGMRKIEAFKKYSAKKLSKNLEAPALVFHGENEGNQLILRCKETAELLPKGKLVVVKDTGHQIDHPNYIEAIKKQF